MDRRTRTTRDAFLRSYAAELAAIEPMSRDEAEEVRCLLFAVERQLHAATGRSVAESALSCPPSLAS